MKKIYSKTIFLIEIFLSVVLIEGQSFERLNPSNTAVVVGKQFSLVCEKQSNRSTATWNFLALNSYADRVIYNGTHGSDQFRDFQVQITDDGISNLTKRLASKDDAGTYKCIRKSESKVTTVRLAQVIVLSTDPVCNPKETNILEGQYLEINCSVNYTGSLSPFMKWSMDDNIDFLINASVTNIPVNNYSPTISTLKMYATRRSNNATFKCTTHFNQQNVSNENVSNENETTVIVRKATNAPTYEHQCIHRLSVLYGNPTPTFEWTELGSKSVLSKGSSLTVNSTAMVNHTYKCTATSNTTGKLTNISTTVTILAVILSPVGRNGVIRNISIVAGSVVALLCVVALFTCGVKRLKVSRTERATAKCEQRTPGSSVDESDDAKTSIPLRYFGCDGTEYMEVNAVHRQPMPARLPAESNMFSVVDEYAFIDHTLSPPVPPREKVDSQSY